MVEFSAKTVAIIAVAAVILISVFIFGIILLGNYGEGGWAQTASNICYFDPFTVQNSGTVQYITVTLATTTGTGNGPPPISGTVELGLYNGGALLTSGSASVTITQPDTQNGGQNVTVATVTQPQVTASEQYYLAAWFSACTPA